MRIITQTVIISLATLSTLHYQLSTINYYPGLRSKNKNSTEILQII
ncbi:MAG: hypothetical protein LBE12_06390 [Planctomycetaceae bacterium]|nr:hypothetical protein [Planctomycetaceae bacterium]